MLRGISISEGIGIGTAYVIKEEKLTYEERGDCDVQEEIARLHRGVETFCDKTEAMAEKMEGVLEPEDVEIIRGHNQMLKDPYMLAQMEERIKEGVCAEAACEGVLDLFVQIFSQAEDELTRQRAADVEDIKKRMLQILLDREEKSPAQIPAGSILVVEELTPSMIAEMNREHVCGIVTEKGGTTSHSAILARALEIPSVFSVEGAAGQIRDGEKIIADGSRGIVLQNPDAQQEAEYCRKKKAYEEKKQRLQKYLGKPTLTGDDVKKEVYCNIGKIGEAADVAEKDGEGIGLFRTEFLFMDKKQAPSEEEQFQAYKKAAQVLKGRTVIIRTLDVGGDKEIPYLNMEKEENPFLGLRAVRYCLEHKALYDTQLRALVRASAFGKIKIMIPLVTNVQEVREVKRRIRSIEQEFDAAGIPYDSDLQVGVMIETPAASLIADLLAKESDFFSIGTNDLTQYTMAADRGNEKVAYLNRAYDPAVLRSVRHVIRCGTEAGIPVGMCGEAAANPLLIPLWLAFGLEEFSVSPVSVLAARYEISKWSIPEAEKVAEQAMVLDSAEKVYQFLNSL